MGELARLSGDAASHLRLVPLPPQRTLGDLLHELARRPGGHIAVTAIRTVVLFWLAELPPES